MKSTNMELPNKYDTYNWIIKVGESCETLKQYISWKRLCRSFYILYKDYKLRDELSFKADLILKKINYKWKI